METARICRIIEKQLRQGTKNFVIYPFGEQGMYVKQLLHHRYGISPLYVVDNGYTADSDIITTEKL